MSRRNYERILDELKRNSRIVHSVMFLEGKGWPQRLVEAYLLQGAEELKGNLI